ncbi:MAG: diguanylate cyclase [Oscillospiraceae bacterium]|nr:diguanylate cyclase [Oscillospiraceae bacterium]
MYLCNLKFLIVTASEEPERLLHSVALPEDCELEVCSVSELDESRLTSLDCAIISDGDPSALIKAESVKGVKKVLLTESSELKKMSAWELDPADDIFVMPDDARYDKTILTTHFRRLINTMKNESDARKEKIYFETAIDSIPDLVWFKDSAGAHLIVNDSFCKLVEKTKEQIYKRGHYYIWDIPKEEYEKGEYVCLESEDEVVQARATCVFDEKIKTHGGMRQFKTYKSPLIDADGSIFGTCGIAHDVTDLHNMNNEINVIIESMPYAIIVEDNSGIIVNTNEEFNLMFGVKENLKGITTNQWIGNYITGRIERVPDKDEFMINDGGETKTINFKQQYISDIFGETIGSMGIFRDITIERKNELMTIKSANTDFLTKLNNRRSLFAYLEKKKRSPQFTFVCVDLDNFKQVNDVYGHHKGDEALLIVTNVMKESFPDDFIARLGGDEFLIVINRNSDIEQIKKQVSEFQSKLNAEYTRSEEFKNLTTSIGIAVETLAKCGKYDFDKILRQSDRALYKAKNGGKAQFCVYE